MSQRQNQELKRRTRVVRVFPYEQLLLRLVSALLMETNQEWTERIYLNMNEEIFCRSWPDGLHRIGKENTMPQSSHDQAAELHNLASHAHAVAAVAHGKADHRTAHELSKQAYELSREALKHSEQLDTAAAESTKAETG
jgi:hypothetical protein